MSINFSTLKKLTIPEGVVKQITDASGRVLWSASKPIVLTVEKVTATTYAGETAYNDEQFILLEIYPKTNGTVKVTYGGLTKTITDTSGVESPNAQGVYFGTFNGVSDSVATPSSGTLTIDGDCDGFACGSYSSGSKSYDIGYCGCITGVQEFGGITYIANYAFRGCAKLALTSLPSGITSIGSAAFYGCSNIALTSLPSGITSIGSSAFYGCIAITLSSLPSGITDIPDSAFAYCRNLALTSLPSKLKTIGSSAFAYCTNIALTAFPEGLTSIGSSAFMTGDVMDKNEYGYVSNTRNITLPSTLLSVGRAAFVYMGSSNYWPNLETIKILATKPPAVEIDENSSSKYCTSFGYHSSSSDLKKITVPKGCGATYKAATGWSTYADIIEEAT